VAAVKKGCQLYKDIKSAAGDVRGVVEDLEKQFAKKHEEKPPTREQRKQFDQKKKEIVEELNQDPNNIMAHIGDQLGTFFDAMDQIEALYYEEEKKSKEFYTGDVSLSKRALDRVLIQSRLAQMEVELREQMIYNVPADLKDLWTRFQQMRVQITEEQRIARIAKEKKDAIRRNKLTEIGFEIGVGVGLLFVLLVMAGFFTWLHYDKKKRWPELEQKTYQQEIERERKHKVEKIYEALRYLDQQNYEKK
jgi:hypothetical protein